MKIKLVHIVMSVVALQVPISLYAHEQEDHANMGSSKEPNCTAMKDMDHGKMDMNDPVTQAMMQKCMSHDMQGHSNDHKNSTTDKKSDMQHNHQ
ncbi:MAG: hypothetical protein VX829_07955 [Pseudomonadota bacterium]|jgi:hypothetical protein|nr:MULTISPECIES: hypothetical protein [Methylophaga]MEC9412596.1 hypothetical protein [Pseudomonadota bacterium]WVI83689.1 hypothetical protein VSX76_01165 [Methylophaga thalassica]HIC45330.1 hypothetical protein [Methylophaga sp.]HIM41030.1 hypothetical protein [Methylophaga aminisulfidivorans]